MAQNDDPERSGLELGFVDAIETRKRPSQALLTVVKPETSAPKPAVSKPAAATGRAPAEPPRRSPMAARTRKTPTLAQLQARRAELDAQISAAATPKRRRAAIRGPEPAPRNPQAEEPAPEPAAERHAGPRRRGRGGRDDKKPPESGRGREAAKAERDAILASAEAKAHPHLALAAVRDGLTSPSSRARSPPAETPRRGALAQAMAGARRLGPDAAKPGRRGRKPAGRQRQAHRRRSSPPKR
jgi:hypothetical protein